MAAEPLAGRGIVVTRPRELAGALAAALERAGARALLFPTIEIEEVPPPPALAQLESYELVVFISPSAVQRALARVGGWPPGVRAAAVGAGTRRELERFGVGRVIAPPAGADSESLLALGELQQMAGRRVLILRGGEGRALLGDTLAARGARVEYADCYRRVRPQSDPAPLLAAWSGGEVDAVTVSSSAGLENLHALIGARGAERLAATPLFVPHARVAARAKALGAAEVVVAGAGDDALIERLVAYFHERA